MNALISMRDGSRAGLAEIGWLVACLGALLLADSVLAWVIGLL